MQTRQASEAYWERVGSEGGNSGTGDEVGEGDWSIYWLLLIDGWERWSEEEEEEEEVEKEVEEDKQTQRMNTQHQISMWLIVTKKG